MKKKTKPVGRAQVLAGVALLALLAACDDGGGGPPNGPSANRNPTVTVTATETQALVGATNVGFAATASDPDGDALTYSWTFGDGTGGGAPSSVTHSFQAPGTFNVTVTVTDGRQGTATASVPVTAVGVTGAWTSQARAWDFELQQSGNRITGSLVGFKNVSITPIPLTGTVTSPRSIQFDVPGGLSFEGTVNATGTQMTGTLSELSRRYGEILDKR